MLDVEGGVVFHLVLAELGGRDLICNFRPGENRHRLGRYLVGPSYGDEEKVGNREPRRARSLLEMEPPLWGRSVERSDPRVCRATRTSSQLVSWPNIDESRDRASATLDSVQKECGDVLYGSGSHHCHASALAMAVIVKVIVIRSLACTDARENGAVPIVCVRIQESSVSATGRLMCDNNATHATQFRVAKPRIAEIIGCPPSES